MVFKGIYRVLDSIYGVFPEFLKAFLVRTALRLRRRGLERVYFEFAEPGDLVFDVGANVGDYSQLMCEMGYKVISVEPNPLCIDRLQKRFETNSKVVVIPNGVGKKKGKLPFFVSEKFHASSTFSQEWKSRTRFNGRRWDRKIRVPVTTLDELIKKYGTPSFIKIDVEGFEYEVLNGLSKGECALSIEFAMEYFEGTRKAVKRLMEIGNPQFNYIPFTGTRYAFNSWVTGGQLISYLEKKGKWYGGDIYVRFV